jgi:gliding motility-associated-like protein
MQMTTWLISDYKPTPLNILLRLGYNKFTSAMRKLLLGLSLITSLLTTLKAQVYSDVVFSSTSCAPNTTCTGYVQNPQNVADSSQTNYATLYNGLGVGSAVTLEYGFSTPAQAGALVGVTLQKGNQTLSAGVLSNITVQLLSSTGTVVAQKNGLQLEDLGLLGGSGNTPSYVVTFYTPQGNYDIKRVRITLGGVLNVLNDIRVYNAFYLSPATNGSGQICGLEYATNLLGSNCSGLLCSVGDPGKAVDTLSYDDYATLNIPVGLIGVLGTAEARLSWDTPGDSGQYVGFIIGPNNGLLNVALISSITITLHDAAGNVVHTQNGFSTVDLTLLSGTSQKNIIGFYAPVNFVSARIRLTQIVGLLTSLRVYGAIKFDATPDIVQITTSPFTNLCNGDSVVLTASPGYDQYFWSTGETTQSIVTSQSGTYSLTALDADACLYYSQVQAITINPLPPTPIISGITANPTLLCNGDSATLSIMTQNSVMWSTGETDSSITVQAAGIYSVTVTDSLGCMSTSDTLTIATDSAFVNIISMDSITCQGVQITLIANGSDPVIWSTGTMSDTLMVAPLVTTTYVASVQSAGGCVDSASLQVTVKPLPTPPTISGAPADTITLCNGAIQTLVANIPAGTYDLMWSSGDTTNSIDVSLSGSYFLTITDSAGCFSNSDTLVVEADSALINISTASGDSSACFSNTTQIILLSNANGSVMWSTSDTTSTIMVMPNATATYSATVTTNAGCMATDTFTLNINPLPTTPVIEGVEPGASSLVICNGASVTFSVTTTDNATWNTGDTTNAITVSTPGQYFVTIEDVNGCTATSDTLDVLTETASISLLFADSVSCGGESITIVIAANGPVVWNDGSTGTTFTATPTVNTTYTATVTTPLNCQEQLMVTVTVSDTSSYANAQNDEGFTLSNTPAPEVNIADNDTYSGTAIWSILGGASNGTANISGSIITYTPNADYTGIDSVTYLLCSVNSCGTVCDTATIIYTIELDPNPIIPGIKIPGGISPNGDGTNDGFVIDGLHNFPKNKLTILNRWGDILFKAEPYNNDWDGTASQGLVMNNAPVPDGTYYYVLVLGDGSKPVRGFIEVRK